jgi:hypothetical protein
MVSAERLFSMGTHLNAGGENPLSTDNLYTGNSIRTEPAHSPT